MPASREIKVVLTADDNGFSIKTRAAADAVKGLKATAGDTTGSINRLENAYNSLWGKFHRGVTTLGTLRFALMDVHDVLLKFPLAILKTSGDIEKMTVMLEGLSTASTDAAKKLEAASNVKFLFNMAQNAPFEVKALSDAFVKLKVAGIDPTNGSLQALIDGIAKFGGGSDELKRSAIAIQQMAGKGVISMEELRQQLGEAMPTAMRAMAEGMGISMSELANQIKKGTVESTGALEKMFFVMKMENQGAADKMMGTWNGLVERLKTKWELFKLRIGQEGMFDGAKKELEGLLNALDGGAAGDLGARIGQILNNILVNVIQFTKWLIESWDWIVMIGKGILLWKTAMTAVNVAQFFIGPITEAMSAITAAHEKRLKQIAEEQHARQTAAAAQSVELRNWISDNNKKIDEEKKRLSAVEAVGAQELQSKIRNNQMIIAAHNDRAAQLLKDEQVYLGQQMAMELEAEKVARSKKAGSAAAARGLTADAADIGASAAAIRAQRQAYLDQAAALAAANAQMTKNVETMKASALANSPLIAQLERKNKALEVAAVKNGELALKMAGATRSASLLGSALAGVGGFLGALLSPLNLVLLAVTAGAAAWEYYGNKARAAAQQAALAAGAKEKLARGQADEATVKAVQGESEKLKADIEQLNRDIQLKDESVKLLQKRTGSERKAQAAAQELARMKEQMTQKLQEVDRLSQTGVKVKEQLAANEGERRAIDVMNQAEREMGQKLAGLQDQRVKLRQEFAKIQKPTDSQEKSYHAKDMALQKQRAQGELEYWTEEKAKIQEAIKAGKGTAVEIESYKRMIGDIEKKRTDALEQLQNRDRPVGTTGKPPKVPKVPKGPKVPELPKSEPVDALLLKIQQDNMAITKLKGQMQAGNGELVELKDLRDQAIAEIAAIMDGDRRYDQPSKVEDIDKAVDQLTQRKVLEMAVREMRNIMPQVQKANEEVRQLQDRVANGEIDEQPDHAENKTLITLQRMIQLAPSAKQALQPVIDAQRKLLDDAVQKDALTYQLEQAKKLRDMRVQMIQDPVERARAAAQQEIDIEDQKNASMRAKMLRANMDVTAFDMQAAEIRKSMVGKFTSGGEKELQDLRISTIVDGRQRMLAEQQRELDDIRSTYAERIRLAKENGQDITQLQDQLNEMLDLKSKQHAEALKTPLDRLVDQWKDTDERIRDLQANVADSFVNMLTDGLGEGKLKFDEWISQVLLEITNMKLKAALADPLSNVITGMTDALRGTGYLPAVKNPETQYELSGFAAVNRQALQAGTALDTMSTQGVAQAAAASSQSAMADQQATMGTQFFTNALYQAAAAAQSFAATMGVTSAFDAATGFAGVAAGSFGGLSSSGFGTGDAFGNMDMGAFFADGGIYDPAIGRVPLRKYRRGGIANTPQAAIYGEGDTPEAYVPLPDGRSIPVNMQGGAGANVTVNVINQTNTQVQATQSQPKFDGKQMVLDVVLTAVNQPGPFRDGMKGAMR